MAITYKELKDRLTDLGFEEDDVVESDYKRIYINSFNRAGEILYGSVMLGMEDYIRKTEEIDDEEDMPAIMKIDEDTLDDDYINVPDILVPLYTLLAAHYAWLDDDLTKATIYWNEYDDLKNQIMMNANKPRKATITGGIRF
jgi:hypothetical protein